MIRLYTDAAVNGNPGDAGIGLLILTDNEQIQLSSPLANQWNNHQAEFKALLEGLKWLVKNDYTDELTFCYTDSQTVAQSVEKEYVKDTLSNKFLQEILTLMLKFSFISVDWIPESKNRGADNLAKQALRKSL